MCVIPCVCEHGTVHKRMDTQLYAHMWWAHVSVHTFIHVLCVHISSGIALQPCPPALKPREGNREFCCGCNPCTYNAREGIIPGINILNSPIRPTPSKILRPVIVLLSLGLLRS